MIISLQKHSEGYMAPSFPVEPRLESCFNNPFFALRYFVVVVFSSRNMFLKQVKLF